MAEKNTVSSAELVRHFARYRDEANRNPVYVSHHGRKTHVLCSVDDFGNLPVLGSSPEERAAAAGFDMVFGLADWINEALIICTDQLEIQFANRNAHAITHKSHNELDSRSLLDALPEIAGSLVEVHLQHTLLGGEPSSGDIPSPFKQDAWLSFQSFPLDHHIVLKFRDITEDVLRHRLADINASIKQAMSAHGAIGYVRVSVRGTIDRVEDTFCKMLGLPEDRLIGALLSDLVTVEDRVAFRDMQEAVLRGEASASMACRLLSNNGELLDCTVAIARLQGAYGAEGAVFLITPLG